MGDLARYHSRPTPLFSQFFVPGRAFFPDPDLVLSLPLFLSPSLSLPSSPSLSSLVPFASFSLSLSLSLSSLSLSLSLSLFLSFSLSLSLSLPPLRSSISSMAAP